VRSKSEGDDEGVVDSQEAELFIADLDTDELRGKCIYFVRQGNKDMDADTMDKVLCSGELSAPLLESLDLMFSEVHAPHLKDGYDWSTISTDGRDAFLMAMESLKEHVQEAVSGIHGGAQLCPLDADMLTNCRASSHGKGSVDDGVMSYIDQVWCGMVWPMMPAVLSFRLTFMCT
jgi:hypothetical protein